MKDLQLPANCIAFLLAKVPVQYGIALASFVKSEAISISNKPQDIRYNIIVRCLSNCSQEFICYQLQLERMRLSFEKMDQKLTHLCEESPVQHPMWRLATGQRL